LADPRLSVVVCCWSEERWDDLVRAVASVRDQADEVVVVVDHNAALLERARTKLTGAVVVAGEGPPGVSGARNTGISRASGELIAFLDDDAVAAPGWGSALRDAFAAPAVAGAGGPVEAAWDTGPPRWFPAEMLWVVGCSYRGQATGPVPIRNPIGANMAFRRSALARAGKFAGELGRTGTASLGGCEETEYAIRLRRLVAGAEIVNVPGMAVRHRVPRVRATPAYFVRRCFAEGRAKARVSAAVGPGAGLASERAYVVRALPAGIVRGLGDALRGDPAGLARAVGIGAGLALTGAGYAWGLIASARRAASPPAAPATVRAPSRARGA
jgi:hypothetical protein